MRRIIVAFLLIVVVSSCKTNTNKVEDKQSSKLLEQFAYNPDSPTIISVHRGGKGLKNFPENCLETLQYINDSIKNVIFEIDVAKTKDDVLVLMHDNTLDRTSTGSGQIANKTYKDLQSINLKDDFGSPTSYKIPIFKNVLEWAKTNNVVLTIDIKRSVAVEQVVKLINEVGAQDVSIIITYDMEQAERAYKIAPELVLSVSARNEKELDWLIHSGIPTKNMLAFTGTRLSPDELYKKIHSYGIKTILGTLGNLDKQAESKGDSLYQLWVNNGIDVIATDRPFAAYRATKQHN
ncbi:glycerophosphodiester phosphodiesterase family protein [Seonamhaeicola marinus]|uniref:Glycerophosphodiester phosphodiesterase family protein n=1 Tax=Seonamhaeicola marinus TaxID=1912246 RepID=A0A5D0JL21_9FLAO|nr:glycerophosphodiester phosphodiesterase family protein [Seonamhaeicola marinus]TYA94742.1 glycerophosphodiester phosphodiesterase family protein [Seonamhaeicola marinus]